MTTHSSPSRTALVASDARSEPAPGSLKSWHHFSSLRTIGGRNRSRCSSVPWRTARRAALLSPSGFSRPRLNGRAPRRSHAATWWPTPRPPYSRRPGRHHQPRRGERPDTRLVVGAGCARPAARRAPRRRPRATARAPRRRPMPTASTASRGGRGGDRQPSHVIGPGTSASRLSRKAARPSLKSSLRLTTVPARTPRCARWRSRSRPLPLCSSHLVRPERDRRRRQPSCVDESRPRRVQFARRACARWIDAPVGRGGAARSRSPSMQQLSGAHHRRSGAAAATSAPLSGVKPRSHERLPEPCVVGGDREVGGERDVEARCPAAQPRTTQTMGTCICTATE